MSYDDFCRMTPEDMFEVSKAHMEYRSEASRDRWECMRTLAAVCVQPHINKKMTAKKLIPLPWDKEQHPVERTKVTPEEAKRRKDELLKILKE